MANRPVPTALKLLRGNPGHRPINENEPKPDPGAEMPADLSPQAAEIWPQIAEQLQRAGVLTQIDAPALALYCEAYARWKDANDKVVKLGAVVRSPNGFPMQSPYLPIANKAFEQMRRMLIEFGMTPASRSKVTAVGKSGPKNRFDKFKGGGAA